VVRWHCKPDLTWWYLRRIELMQAHLWYACLKCCIIILVKRALVVICNHGRMDFVQWMVDSVCADCN